MERNRNKEVVLKDIIARYEELWNDVRKDSRFECKELSMRYCELTETETHKIARLLHEQFCNSNHIDQCAWYYETIHHGLADDWSRSTHRRYLEKAIKVEAAGFTYTDIYAFFEALNSK